MKTTIKLICGIFLTGLFLAATGAYSQTPVGKITLDNESVKVISIEFKPGDITAIHSHPDNVTYIMSGGKMEYTDKGEKPKVINYKTGETIWMPAVTHIVKNVGNTNIKMLVVELKQTAQKKKTTVSAQKK